MRIEKYHIVTATRAADIWPEVEEFIEKGFQPYGSPFLIPPGEESEHHLIAQPMVIYADPPRHTPFDKRRKGKA